MSDQDIKNDNDSVIKEDIDTSENMSDEDIVVDDESELGQAELIKKLREKLRNTEKEKQEYLTTLQRTKADYINSKKDFEQRAKDLIKYAASDLISEIIPALDAFDMAMNNKEAWEKVDKNWRNGIEYIYNQLVTSLSKHGMAQENPKGEAFDIMRHHSIETIKTDDEGLKGKVAEVMQKGYSLHGKEIRPATVKVYE